MHFGIVQRKEEQNKQKRTQRKVTAFCDHWKGKTRRELLQEYAPECPIELYFPMRSLEDIHNKNMFSYCTDLKKKLYSIDPIIFHKNELLRYFCFCTFLLCISAKKPKEMNVDSHSNHESRLAEGSVTEYIKPMGIFISSSPKPS